MAQAHGATWSIQSIDEVSKPSFPTTQVQVSSSILQCKSCHPIEKRINIKRLEYNQKAHERTIISTNFTIGN